METNFLDTLGSCKNPPRKPTRTKPGDRRPCFQFRVANDWTFSRSTTPTLRVAPDCEGAEFDADLMAFANQARRALTCLEADFIWLALAVYFADRCAPRYPYGNNGPAFWRRRIHVALPVSDVERWRAAEESLLHALEYLTEDDWTFEFEPGRSECSAEMQRHFPEMRVAEIEWAALFSGGLDSLAGAMQWLSHTRGTCLLVSGQTHSRITVAQDALILDLRKRFPQRVEHLGVSYGFPDKQRFNLGGFESSQRTRAFVHTALGSLAALMAGQSQLFLFENGFGALNLPCDSAQFGSMNSRGTHPIFLRRMSAFVSAVLDKTFRIVNPFTFWTKGQMLTAPGVQAHRSILTASFSCDRFPNYHHKERQCGACPSCLVRRLAFHTAQIAEPSADYTTEVFHPRRPLRELEWTCLAKLSAQADNFAECLRRKEPWAALCAQWPDLLRADLELQSAEFRSAVITLLNRHVDEWRSFSAPFLSNTLALAA